MIGKLISKRYTYEELSTIINSLDLMSRIYIGQYDHIFDHIIWNNKDCTNIKWEKIESLSNSLFNIRYVFIPYLRKYTQNASLGIWNKETPLIAIRSYDIMQILRFQKSWHDNPKGDYSISFDSPFIHGKWRISNEIKAIIDDYIDTYKYKNIKPYGFHSKWDCPLVIIRFDDINKTCELKAS